MNCKDVTAILDDSRIDQLAPRDRLQAEDHMATCDACRRAWTAQATLAELPDMAVPADFQARCRAAVEARAVAGFARSKPGYRRVVVWGSLTAMAAAAAMLVPAYLAGPGDGPSKTTENAQGEGAQPDGVFPEGRQPVAGRTGQTATPGVSATSEGTLIPFTARVSIREPDPQMATGRYAAAVEPAAREVRESLRSALVAELGKVPGLSLVEGDPASIPASSRHFDVRITSAMILGVDGQIRRTDGRHPIALDVQELLPGGKPVERRSAPKMVAVEPHATCTDPAAAESSACDVPTTAVYLANYLRQQVFPPDASIIQPLQAKLADFSQSPEERFASVVELYRQQTKIGGRGLFKTSGVVRSVVELAGLTDAAHRAQLWRVMRGVGDPMLLEPLAASMQLDPEAVRIAAVETLAEYRNDPRGRLALEQAAAADSSSLVRALARCGLEGEAAWQAYVVSSLKDATLPASQRVEALLHELYAPSTIDGVSEGSTANYRQVIEGLDDAAVRALAEVFPQAPQLRKWPANNLINNFAHAHVDNPAVTEMLLTTLGSDAYARNRSAAGEVLARKASEPPVRDALRKAVSSDPDAQVRNYLRQVLERDHVKMAMEATSP